MKLKETKKRKYSLARYIFAGIVVCVMVVLIILLSTGIISDTFPDSVMDVFQKISIISAVLVFVSFFWYGIMSEYYESKTKKYEKIIKIIGKNHINKVNDNSQIFPIEKIGKNEKYAKKYQEYKAKADAVKYTEKAVFSILLAITVISIDIPIFLWFIVLVIAIILAMDSVSSYLEKSSTTHKKNKK